MVAGDDPGAGRPVKRGGHPLGGCRVLEWAG